MGLDCARTETSDRVVVTVPGMSARPHRTFDADGSPEVIAALQRLHEAASALLAHRIPDNLTVREASRRLGVGHRLAWTLLNFQRASSVTRMVRFLPGRRGWMSFLEIFEGQDEVTGLVERARAARADFQRICEEQGVDLTALAAPRARRSEAESEEFRREAYLTHRSAWPVHAHAKIVANLVAPTVGRPELGSMATVMMLAGLERATPGPPLEIARTIMPEEVLRSRLPDGTDHRTAFGFGGPMPPLLERFSTPGVVDRELHRLEDQDGQHRVGFGDLDAGRTDPLRLTFGQILPALGPVRGGPDDAITFAVETPGPVEWSVLDVLWPRDLPAGGPLSARLSIFSGVAGTEPVQTAATFPHLIERLDTVQLERIELPGLAGAMTVPYRKALEAAAEALGRSLEDFEIHRSILHYSLPRTSIVATRPLAPSSS